MAIILWEVSDTDIARGCEIDSLAFKDNPLGPILNPGPFPPGVSQQRIQQTIDMRKNDSSVHLIQAFDEETAQMVAWAKWHVFETAEAALASFQPLRPGPGMNADACKIFFEGVAERRKVIMGEKPYLYLQLLYTHPGFQGRGAGSLLIDWGKQCAKDLGLPIYLASTPVGHRFYQKHDFEDVEIYRLDFTSFGGPVHEQPLMVWKPPRS